MAGPSTAYISGGQMLQSPPLTVKIKRFFIGVYMFLGLYVTTLFSFDAYAAAEASPFNVRRTNSGFRSRAGFRVWGGSPGSSGGSGGGGGGGGGGGRGGGGSSGGGGKRLGTVDDVRAPECGSCQG